MSTKLCALRPEDIDILIRLGLAHSEAVAEVNAVAVDRFPDAIASAADFSEFHEMSDTVEWRALLGYIERLSPEARDELRGLLKIGQRGGDDFLKAKNEPSMVGDAAKWLAGWSDFSATLRRGWSLLNQD